MEILFVIAGAGLGWVGAYLQHRWQRGDRVRTALREAYADALARLEQFLHAGYFTIALQAEEEKARAELRPVFEQKRLELEGDLEALAKLEALAAQPPDPGLRKRLDEAISTAIAMQHAVTLAKHRLMLLETDGRRLDEVRRQFRDWSMSGTDRQADLELLKARQVELEVFAAGLGRALRGADGEH